MLKVNEYFGGQVKSIAVENSQSKATIGAIEPGEYEFGTSSIEIMMVVSGTLNVLLPGQSNWKSYTKGEKFEIGKGETFKVKAEETVGYFCIYIN
jgi:Uncharacterized protein conserved in bacteria